MNILETPNHAVGGFSDGIIKTLQRLHHNDALILGLIDIMRPIPSFTLSVTGGRL